MAVNTSLVTSAGTNGNVTINPNGTGNVVLTKNAGAGEEIVGVDNGGVVKKFALASLAAKAAAVDTDKVLIEESAGTKKYVTVTNLIPPSSAGVYVSDTAPTTPAPEQGDLWWDSARGIMFVYYDDLGSQQWVDISPNGTVSTGSIVSPTPPASPSPGDLWFNSSDSRLYVYYSDFNSNQWIDCSPQSGGGTES